MERYLAYTEDPDTNKEWIQGVIDYNQNYCEATRVIKDRLVEQAAA